MKYRTPKGGVYERPAAREAARIYQLCQDEVRKLIFRVWSEKLSKDQTWKLFNELINTELWCTLSLGYYGDAHARELTGMLRGAEAAWLAMGAIQWCYFYADDDFQAFITAKRFHECGLNQQLVIQDRCAFVWMDTVGPEGATFEVEKTKIWQP